VTWSKDIDNQEENQSKVAPLRSFLNDPLDSRREGIIDEFKPSEALIITVSNNNASSPTRRRELTSKFLYT
jgi:hypothetical protein